MPMISLVTMLAKFTFEKPTTKDFVWPCVGGGNIGGFIPCANFISFLVLLAVAAFLLFFFFAFRKPKLVPGKLQLIAEMGFDFVKENVILGMMGPEGMVFFALLSTFFFYILIGNLFEIVPGVNFSMNSRIAFPIVLAIVSWLTYLIVGFRKHGIGGYLKMVAFPPGVPKVVYILLTPIELLQVFFIRPLTLSVRLFANMVAGHFLLAVFFLATFGFFASLNALLMVLGIFSGALALALLGFEIFVSGLQAFIFAVLTASYIQGAMADEH
jgi:F-type H+-transporting ATPase subunit a